MFKHGKTGQPYYSIREKINYYKKVINGTIDAPIKTRRKAKVRLQSLTKLNNRTFAEPTFVVTDDKHFENGISKPRICIVVATDEKGKVLAVPLNKRTTRSVVLDRQPDRQIDERKKWIDRCDIYETKYVTGIKPLTKYDKVKIRNLYHQ